MAMVNPINPMLNPNAKDSRWLTLEVCREYQRNKCTRTENECKFAHPPAHVEVQNGRVIACFDSIKGKCQRKDPPCKYLHPPQHLREQLLQNGRNNLILKSLQYQALQQQVLPGIIPMTTPVKSVAPAGGKPMAYPTAVLPGPYVAAATPQSRPAVSHPASFVSFAPSALTARAPHYLSTVPTTAVPQFSPYGIPTVAVQGGAADGTIVTSQMPSVISTPMQTKAPARPDRLEPPMVEVLAASKKRPRDPADDLVLPQLGLVPPYKRVAVESANLGKGGIPVYQPTLPAAAYHQAATLMQLQQQPYFPAVTYSGEVMSAAYPNYLQQDPTPLVVGVSAQPPGVGAAADGVPSAVTAAAASAGVALTRKVPNNAYSVQYFDRNKQLLDTLPLCPDFRVGRCDRPTCPMVHVLEDVEMREDGRVVVCRDSQRNACKRASCKYYHIPVPLPPST